MHYADTTSKNKGFTLVMLVLLGIVALVGLQGCGGGSSGGSSTPANPAGYYNAGNATIIDPADGSSDLVLGDLQGLISGNRFMIMSLSAVVLYDGTITSITGNDFSATVKIYYGMDAAVSDTPPTPIDTTITGTITEGSQLSGTIAGTGIGSGNFSLTFSQTNSTDAVITNVVSSWTGGINTVDQISFDFLVFDTSGVIDVDLFRAANNGIFESCQMAGAIAPVAISTVFTLDLNLTDCGVGPSNNGNYTGFATTTDSNHTSLVIMFSNGTVSAMSVLAKL